MTVFVALLPAVNVGGTGKLPMTELKAICEAVGFKQVETYIASGNVVFESSASESAVMATLEDRLRAYAGKPVGMLVCTRTEISDVLANNSFPEGPGNRTVAIFLDEPPRVEALDRLVGQTDEKGQLGDREIYI